MAIFRSGNFRLLYLLALLQLVGGPIMLLQVSLFSKLVIQEAPRVGLLQAVSFAWDSPEFRDALADASVPWKNAAGTTSKEDKAKPDCPAAHDLPWNADPRPCPDDPAVCGVLGYFRIWTPQWPHAPPGPPPRMA
ncbi:hypothetical protein HZ994_13225 [Akkermansiaceae bacterium]|nr:hypothetical protein HZ994_13225 [Akkermansiaceae bacterium]